MTDDGRRVPMIGSVPPGGHVRDTYGDDLWIGVEIRAESGRICSRTTGVPMGFDGSVTIM
jgi:hypothetical protein